MGLGSAVLAARLGRLTALAQCLPTARQHLRAILPDASEEEILNAVPLQEAQGTLHLLDREYGITISASGGIARRSEPTLNLQDDFKIIRGLMGTLTRAIHEREQSTTIAGHVMAEAEASQAATSLRRTDPPASRLNASKALAHQRHRVRLRSCAGTGVHGWAEECPKAPELCLNDAEFQFSVRYRLGLPVMTEGLCQLCSKSSEEWCGKPRNVFGDHVQMCGMGCGRYRAHNALC